MRVDAAGMTSILTEPVAATVVILDATGGSTLSGIARAAGRPLSTIQRAIDSLIAARIIERLTPRGPLRFTASAPRQALRDLAEWRLGRERTASLTRAAHATTRLDWPSSAPSIRSRLVREAMPQAIDSIVAAYHPARVILFGSQARGDAQPDSDVDLLVVFDQRGDDRERRIGIRRALKDMPFAKDVLVATTRDLSHAAAGTAIAEALRDGVTVYER